MQNRLVLQRYWVFYILVAYILAVFFWWWILLFRKNEDLYREKVQLLYYRYRSEDSALFVEKNEQLEKEYARQRWMILGEGATFIFLLGIGIFRLRRTIMKEVELAGRQRNFLLSITHELKSPLASAQLNLQTIRKRRLNKEQSDMLLVNTESDITRLNELVEKILLASKIDHRNFHIDKEWLNYSALVHGCCDQLISRHPETEIKRDIADHIAVAGDAVLLQSLVNNLLENACKYAPPGTPVTVVLKRKETQIVLDIADEGKPIPAEEREKIFERFYRMGNEETRTSPGVGLGLFIVKQVAHLHHGQVTIIDRPDRGKIFRVILPTEDRNLS
jgi:signal transduction histidine kinase